MVVKDKRKPDLRSEHAAVTRARVLRAAKKLFGEKGFAATTITDLAQDAGVAVQTLYSTFGSKAAIAREVMMEAVVSSGIREADQAALTDPDGVKAMRRVAHAATLLYESQAEIIKLLTAEVAADFRRLADSARLQNLKDIAASSPGIRRFRNRASSDEAAVAAWAVSGFDSYDRLVVQAGWRPDRYERWLGNLLISYLVKKSRST